MPAWSVSTVERHMNTVRCMQAVWAWPAVLDYMISYRAYVCGGCQGPGGVLGVVLLRVGAFPIGRARSDQQLASSETHSRAPAGCVLASLIFKGMQSLPAAGLIEESESARRGGLGFVASSFLKKITKHVLHGNQTRAFLKKGGFHEKCSSRNRTRAIAGTFFGHPRPAPQIQTTRYWIHTSGHSFLGI